ncbi:MAG: tRNA pseudouridine(55) synthase TruB [Chloroflexaceae bacterium]|nr:tRNA pseudouridine(55) synthase TruB [Chloroflexaceae bacterium]
MRGFLNINKPAGLTSHDVVARIRRLAGRRVKTGHAGTLDPAATGVLPVALGSATRLIEYLSEARKGYRATVGLGMTTTTDDAEGDILTEQHVPLLNTGQIEEVLNAYRGDIWQVPPMYAALHHEGQRLYDLARSGQVVERAPRAVTITTLDMLDWQQQPDAQGVSPPGRALLTLEIICSKGTYVRSLARDIGAALGCGGYLVRLERTWVGPFQLAHAVALQPLVDGSVPLAEVLRPPETAIADWPMITLQPTDAERVRHGLPVLLDYPSAVWLRAHTADGRLLAILRPTATGWHPVKVLS